MKQVTLTLEKMAHGGEALGYHEGKAVFVAYALPGEKVLVELTEEKKTWARGNLLKVLEHSAGRVPPRCPYFGECGGCQWQHIAYERQLEFKQDVLADQLARIGKLGDVEILPVIPSPWEWHYRNSVRFIVTPEGRLAFRAFKSHEPVTVDECYILHPLVEEVLGAVELDVPQIHHLGVKVGVNTGDQILVLETSARGAPEAEVDVPVSCVLVPPSGPPVVMAGSDHIFEEVTGWRFRISALSFFQVNTPQAERLVELVEDFLAPEGSETLLDGYCGVGLFGIALAGRVGKVIGIEVNPFAVNDALINAEKAGARNVVFIRGAMEEVLPGLEERVDIAVVDPPRTGMEKAALQALVNLSPRRIAYVSCDPATLARDLAALVEAGYRVVQIQPVDMFPQTYHIESVTLLVRD